MTCVKNREGCPIPDHPELTLDSILTLDNSFVKSIYSVGGEWVFKDVRAATGRIRVFNHKISSETEKALPESVKAQYEIALKLGKTERWWRRGDSR